MTIPNSLHPETLFRLNKPVFVRKLSRRNHWDMNQGAEFCYDQSFRDDTDEISIWLLSTKEDVARFVLGFNASMPNRSKTEVHYLIPFTEEELLNHGLTPTQSPGGLNCTATDSLHYNIPDDQGKVLGLIQYCIDASRGYCGTKRGDLKQALACLEAAGCLALGSGPCTFL